ncbi:hypothetical protein [Halobacterium yunchengense]|uniref:hypothetical protein n=1 Tax=Halobacterium yunchengense TaxID=3108497 RepID=UPI00300AA246
MRALSAVAAVALLLVAGCSGVAPDPTPAPSPDDAPTTSEPSPPPGVTDGELTDPGLLVREHAASVRERGARVVTNSTATVRAGNQTRTVALSGAAWSTPNGTRVYHRSNRLVGVLSESTRRERVFGYANETAVVERRVVDGNATTTVERRGEHADLVGLHVARSRFLGSVLSAGTFRVADVERRDGRTVTTLVADDRSLAADGRSVFAGSVEVTGEGRVLSLSVRRNPDANTDAGRRTYEAVWSSPPSDPEPPEWAQ